MVGIVLEATFLVAYAKLTWYVLRNRAQCVSQRYQLHWSGVRLAGGMHAGRGEAQGMRPETASPGFRRAAWMLPLLALFATSAAVVPSRATFDSVVVEEARIPTRYGEDLRANLAFPGTGGQRAPGRFPVVLTFSPYCDDGFNFLAQAGYVSAWVNIPGTCGSDGRTPIFSERVGHAGYDAVEWLAGVGLDGSPSPAADWSTGAVGMFGASADGISQGFVAQHRPPHLVTIVPVAAMADFYEDSLYRGGMLNVTDSAVFQAIIYGLWYEPGIQERVSDEERRRRMLANGWAVPETDNLELYAHPLKDDFWSKWTVALSQIDVPILSWGNWDDFFTRGNVRMFERGSSPYNALVMGQDGHNFPGPNFDYKTEAVRWFDYWLRGNTGNGVEQDLAERRVRYYVEEEHLWRAAAAWPPPGTQDLVLHPAAGAPIAGATGALASATDGGWDTYVYVPAQGRHDGQDGYVPTSNTKPNRATNDNVVGYNDPAHAGDQRLEAGTLTYVGDVLTSETEATGVVRAALDAASSAGDTDWVIKLIDVFPDGVGADGPQPGYWNLVTTGWLKGTHRDGHVREEPIPQGVTLTYDVRTLPTSYLFRAGHRIAIQIASSDASRSAVNPTPAINTVFHTTTLSIPVVLRS